MSESRDPLRVLSGHQAFRDNCLQGDGAENWVLVAVHKVSEVWASPGLERTLFTGRHVGERADAAGICDHHGGREPGGMGILGGFLFVCVHVGVLQLSHSSHEGWLGHVAAWALLHEGLLVRAVQLLGELDGLQGCQAAGHTVDDRDALSLGGVEALCNGHDTGEGGHDEVLRLLGIMVGQAVDIRQGADRGQTSS